MAFRAPLKRFNRIQFQFERQINLNEATAVRSLNLAANSGDGTVVDSSFLACNTSAFELLRSCTYLSVSIRDPRRSCDTRSVLFMAAIVVEPSSRDPMVESTSSGSSSDTNGPVCAQLLTQLNTAYQHLAPDAQALVSIQISILFVDRSGTARCNTKGAIDFCIKVATYFSSKE